MANTIQIKRSPALLAPLPGTLTPGELAFVDHGAGGANGVLYIGDAATGAVQTIGGSAGSAYVLDLLTDTALTGTPTAPTLAPGNNSTALATTAYVQAQITAGGGSLMSLTDTDFGVGTDANSQALANANIAIYDLAAGKWENKAVSGGNVVLDQEGGMTVNAVQADAINPDTDLQQNYVSAVTGTASEIQISSTGGGQGTRGVTSQIGLTTDVIIAGNLTVSGLSTVVSSTTVSVADPVFVLGQATPDSFDRGIEFNYNDGTSKQGFFGHDTNANAFTYIPDGIVGNIATGSVGNAIFADITGANITGTLVTADQPNVTTMGALVEVGTITTGTWNGTEIAQDKGGTGRTAFTADNDLLIGAGTGAMTVLQMGTSDQYLHVNGAGTALEYTSVMDGGIF